MCQDHLRLHIIFDVLLVGFLCEAGFLQVMVHDNIDTSDYCAFGTFALGPFSGGISTNERVINVTLCPTDHLPLLLPTQPVLHLPDLVDVREHLIVSAEVPVDDHDGSWREMKVVLAEQEPGAQRDEKQWPASYDNR